MCAGELDLLLAVACTRPFMRARARALVHWARERASVRTGRPLQVVRVALTPRKSERRSGSEDMWQTVSLSLSLSLCLSIYLSIVQTHAPNASGSWKRHVGDACGRCCGVCRFKYSHVDALCAPHTAAAGICTAISTQLFRPPFPRSCSLARSRGRAPACSLHVREREREGERERERESVCVCGDWRCVCGWMAC